MLESLFSLIKENSTDAIINNPAIPNEQNDAVIADATHSVADGLQGVLAGGGLQDVMALFNNSNGGSGQGNGLMNNPIVSNIINSFTNKLTNNHGVESDQAEGIANSLIPNVLSNLVNKTNDPNNSSFDIGSIIGSLTGGGQAGSGNFDLSGLMSNFTSGGLDANHDGHIGLEDIIAKVTGGARQQQQVQGEGNDLMDMIKGFVK